MGGSDLDELNVDEFIPKGEPHVSEFTEDDEDDAPDIDELLETGGSQLAQRAQSLLLQNAIELVTDYSTSYFNNHHSLAVFLPH